MYKNLETERLTINPLDENDALFILELLNSEGWLQFIGERNVKDENGAKEYIRQIKSTSSYYCSVFRLKGNGLAIGIVTFIYRENQHFPDIGYAMLPTHQKRGYAHEAVKRYIDEIFQENISEKVIGITRPENYPSIRLLEKLGSSFESTLVENGQNLALYGLERKNYFEKG
jgi:RimJ/RimL family protein N-acetyltransferase